MRIFREFAVCGVFVISLISGCSSQGRTFDLDQLQGKVETGWNEVQVTGALGAPTRIDVDGDTRRLRYEGKDGGYIVVTLVGNRVTDARRH